MSVRSDFGGGCGFAEASHVFVFPRTFITTPRMVGGGDLVEIDIGQLAMHTIDQGSEFARVYEQGVLASIAEATLGIGGFVLRQEPQADRDLRAVEELAWEGDHAVHQIGHR